MTPRTASISVVQTRASLGRYLDFYNRKRPHSSLDRRTPDHAYFGAATHPGAGGLNFRRRDLLGSTNRQRLHLSNADSCPNKPGHRCCS
jgi:hypothetical protein